MQNLQEKIYNCDLEERRHRAASGMKLKDYSSFDFNINDNLKTEWVHAGLTLKDLQVILILFSVGQVFACENVKNDIKNALGTDIMKEYILDDILNNAIEHQEAKLYNDEIVVQTISNIEKIPEAVIDSLFIKILQQIQYR